MRTTATGPTPIPVNARSWKDNVHKQNDGIIDNCMRQVEIIGSGWTCAAINFECLWRIVSADHGDH